MKKPYVGQQVLHFRTGEPRVEPKPEDGTLGFVTRVHNYSNGETAVDLIIFPPGYHNGLVRSAVRKWNDPKLNDFMIKDAGMWSETTADKELDYLLEKLSKLLESKAK